MDKFNLTFDGEILAGANLAEVKVRFAQALGIEDPARVEPFFSGKRVTLRRNVDRSTAEAFYTKMHRAGAILKLEQVQPKSVAQHPKPGMNREFRNEKSGYVDQSWPIRSAPPSQRKSPAKPGNAIKRAQELQRKRAEEAARTKADEATRIRAEEQRKRAEEAAHIEAEEERKKAVETARVKAAQEEARRKTAEEAARLKAEEQRKTAEEAARLKAEEQRKKAEEAARLKAEEQRKKAEEAARLKAEEERKKAEEAARIKAEEQRRKAEEAARIKAEEERKKAEEAARIKAAREEARRKVAEEARRQKAQRAETKKKAAAEAAKARAQKEAAREKALKVEAKKKAEVEAARIRQEQAQQKRQRAEEAALAKAEDQLRKAEQRAAAAAQRAEEAVRAMALQEAEKQKALEEVARLRSQEEALEQAALQRAAEGTARLMALQKTLQPKHKPVAEQRHKKRQAGAPNLFSLKPFRNTADIRQRAEKSRQLMKVMHIASAAALLALVILSTRYFLQPPPAQIIRGAEGIVVDGQSGLTIAAGTQLFLLDRAGLDSARHTLPELGINPKINLLGFGRDSELFLQEQNANNDPNSPALLRWRTLSCDVSTSSCRDYSNDLPGERFTGWVADPRTGNVFVAAAKAGLLMKLDSDGEVITSAKVNVPEQATLALQGGLLYMNSNTGPAISIFRPDNTGFGEQLDEVLLFPPGAVEKAQTLVGRFVWSTGHWWVTMINPHTLDVDLYRFDARWNYLSTVPLDHDSYPEQLLNWGDKVLVLERGKLPIQRFNAAGETETPLIPEALQSYIEGEHNASLNTQKLWHVSLGLLALTVVSCYGLGSLHRVRSLVYKMDKVRGAEPIDDKETLIQWIDPVSNRSVYYQKAASAYTLLSLSILVGSLAWGMSQTAIFATALVIVGPAVVLALLWYAKPGHIGIFNDQLVLVDQHDMYHMGGGPRIHYRDNFLIMDDIVVFMGTRRLPAFSLAELDEYVIPRALAGIKVDRKTVLIKLIRSAHPLAKGILACVVCGVAAVMLLLLL